MHLLTTEHYRKLSEAYQRAKVILGPNLLTPIGTITEDPLKKVQGPRLVIELALNEHHSLDDLINSKTSIDFNQKLFTAKYIASGLAWLHGKKVMHYRLKPSNILFTRDWRVKIADYALDLPKKYLDPKDVPTTLFKTHHAHYSAPEIFADQPPVFGSDMWSYGMVLYALVTMKNPYADAKDYEEVASRVKGHNLPELPKNTPHTMREIIHKCWAQKPEERGDFLSLTIEEGGISVFKKIFDDAANESDKEAASIWKSVQAAGPEELKKGDAYPWNIFAPVFFQEMGIKEPTLAQTKCIQALMQLGYNAQDTAPVKREHYNQFVNIFSPLRPSKDFVNSVVELCKQDYFYGVSARGSSEVVLNRALKEKNNKNPFLLRISTTNNVRFCLSYIPKAKDQKAAPTVTHFLIEPPQYQSKGIISFIVGHVKTLGVKSVEDLDRDLKVVFEKHSDLEVRSSSEKGQYGSQHSQATLSSLGSSSQKTLVT